MGRDIIEGLNEKGRDNCSMGQVGGGRWYVRGVGKKYGRWGYDVGRV